MFQPVQFGKNFIIQELDSENYSEFVDLIAEEYPNNDPISIILGANSIAYRECVESLKDFILSQNCSFIARCTNTGKLIGAVVGEDYNAEYDCKKDRALEIYYGRFGEAKKSLFDRGIFRKEWKILLGTWGITRSTHQNQIIVTDLTMELVKQITWLPLEQ
ncbi:UNKNOWN [Stylonychia lemnae]|uniref:N-acetyltransferase domain-containing protein n=1 Tax=Stylonychia lemnae TaxID=5949 RepID=A0A078ACC8_STYLE|nr:UNKNOWN [Stylonychia lemnae]|eukprot:CDW78473.1 UNKNOWN [Stylonychia lemnae]